MPRFTAEPIQLPTPSPRRWNVYRTIRVNGETEFTYVGTVEAETKDEATAQGPALMRELAGVSHLLNR